MGQDEVGVEGARGRGAEELMPFVAYHTRSSRGSRAENSVHTSGKLVAAGLMLVSVTVAFLAVNPPAPGATGSLSSLSASSLYMWTTGNDNGREPERIIAGMDADDPRYKFTDQQPPLDYLLNHARHMGNAHIWDVARRQEAEKSWGPGKTWSPGMVPRLNVRRGYGDEPYNYRVNLLFRKSNQMQDAMKDLAAIEARRRQVEAKLAQARKLAHGYSEEEADIHQDLLHLAQRQSGIVSQIGGFGSEAGPNSSVAEEGAVAEEPEAIEGGGAEGSGSGAAEGIMVGEGPEVGSGSGEAEGAGSGSGVEEGETPAEHVPQWECVESCRAPDGNAVPVRVGHTCEIECLSPDGVNCAWSKGDCPAEASAASPESMVLACGGHHEAVYGSSGYEHEGHWCSCSKQQLQDEINSCLASHGQAVEEAPHLEDGFLTSFYFYPEQNLEVMPDVTGIEPSLQTISPTINFDSPEKFLALSPDFPHDKIAGVWQGKISIETAGVYTFYSSSDDGSHVWIDGKMVVDNGGLHGVEERSGEVTLEAGEHDFQADFFENEGGEYMVVEFSGPDTGNAKELLSGLHVGNEGAGAGSGTVEQTGPP